MEEAKTATEERLLELITEQRLAREHIPSAHLSSAAVWGCMLAYNMPLTAMIRNLGKMSALQMFATDANGPGTSDRARAAAGVHTVAVADRLNDAALIAKSRVHPFSVLLAKATYDRGQGVKGSLEWPVSGVVSAALGTAFTKSFGNVTPTGKRLLQAIDVSGSMAWSPVLGSEVVSARVGAAALAFATQKREPLCTTVGFGTDVERIAGLEEATTLAEATAAVSSLPDGPLDLVLVLDCTGSMGEWIQEARDKLIAITGQLGEWFVGQQEGLRVGFVAYRDHGDENQHVVVQPTSDYHSVLAVIKEQRASGGGDTPEDIARAFKHVGEIEFREGATKLVVHVCDAPCHGKDYNTEHDNYPDGDPNGLDPSHQLAAFAQRGIDYVLFDVAYHATGLEMMTAKFRAAYDSAPGRTSLRMGVSQLGGQAQCASGRLERTILESVERSAYGAGTDCAAPVIWALKNMLEVDTFIVYTDSETDSRGVSAAAALRKYRAAMKIPARMVVVALTASHASVADPHDAGMLDMVGFDLSAPSVIQAFVEGTI